MCLYLLFIYLWASSISIDECVCVCFAFRILMLRRREKPFFSFQSELTYLHAFKISPVYTSQAQLVLSTLYMSGAAMVWALEIYLVAIKKFLEQLWCMWPFWWYSVSSKSTLVSLSSGNFLIDIKFYSYHLIFPGVNRMLEI